MRRTFEITFPTVVPPGFNRLTPNLKCSRFRPRPNWSTKSGARGVKSGGTSPRGLKLQFYWFSASHKSRDICPKAMKLNRPVVRFMVKLYAKAENLTTHRR